MENEKTFRGCYIAPKEFLSQICNFNPLEAYSQNREAVAIIFDQEVFERIMERTKAVQVSGWPYEKKMHRRLYRPAVQGARGTFMSIEIGAPLLVFILEILIALGARKVLLIGTAGSLTPRLGPGKLFVASSAVSKLGVTASYDSKKRRFSSANYARRVTEQMFPIDERPREVCAASVDAFFGETYELVEECKSEGADVIDMESAAAMAVAAARGIELSFLGYVSDTLWAGEWRSYLNSTQLACAQRRLTTVAERWIYNPC